MKCCPLCGYCGIAPAISVGEMEHCLQCNCPNCGHGWTVPRDDVTDTDVVLDEE